MAKDYYIYSNDGNIMLLYLHTEQENTTINFVNNITSNGFSYIEHTSFTPYTQGTYVYSGSKIFNGLSTIPNSQIPNDLYKVGAGNGIELPEVSYIVEGNLYNSTIELTGCICDKPSQDRLHGKYEANFTAINNKYITNIELMPEDIGVIEYGENYKTAKITIQEITSNFTINAIAQDVVFQDIILHPMEGTHQNYSIQLLPKIRTEKTVVENSDKPVSGDAVFKALRNFLPENIKNKFLHTNISTGALEWINVREVLEVAKELPIAEEYSPDLVMIDGHLYFKETREN